MTGASRAPAGQFIERPTAKGYAAWPAPRSPTRGRRSPRSSTRSTLPDGSVVSLVAEADGSVVGHVQRTGRGWTPARGSSTSSCSARSRWSRATRRGIGTALIAAAVAAAAETGAPALFLEGAPSYYSARGFRRADELGFERPSVRIPAPAFQVTVLPAHEEWMTGRLVCDAFWELDPDQVCATRFWPSWRRRAERLPGAG